MHHNELFCCIDQEGRPPSFERWRVQIPTIELNHARPLPPLEIVQHMLNTNYYPILNGQTIIFHRVNPTPTAPEIDTLGPKIVLPSVTLLGHQADIETVISLNDGTIISGDWDHKIKIWNSAGICLTTLEGHTSIIRKLKILRNGNLLSAAEDGKIKIWDLTQHICIKTLQVGTGRNVLILQLDDGTIVSQCGISTQFWNECGINLGSYSIPSIWGMFIKLGNNTFATTSQDDSILLCNKVGVQRIIPTDHTSHIEAMIVLKNGNIVTGDQDGHVKIWDLKTYSCIRNLKIDTLPIVRLKQLQNGWLAGVSLAGKTELWDNNGDCVQTLNGYLLTELKEGSLAIRFDKPDGFDIAICDPTTNTILSRLRGHNQRVCGLIQLQDGSLASWSKDKTIKIWKGESEESYPKGSAVIEGQLAPVKPH